MIRLAFAVVIFVSTHLSATELVLPKVIYAVPDVPVNVVFRNAALIPPESGVVFSCECEIGEVINDERWTLTATEEQTGDHKLTLTVGGKEASTTIRVVPKNAGSGRKMTLLIVGDSLTNASTYPNEISRLFKGDENPELTLIGTHHPKSAAEGVFHEGYGGWTWNRFNTRWEPEENQVGKLRSSPFLSLKDGNPVLDFSGYFEKNSDGMAPDFAIFFLGINDCFHADPGDDKSIALKIDAMLSEAEFLLKAFRKAAPETQIGICLTPAANERDGAFRANYKERYTRWGWRRIQFELVKRQIANFGDREVESVFVVPTSVGIDPLKGYPNDNAVHPNEVGYHEIGAEIFGWLKWRLSKISP